MSAKPGRTGTGVEKLVERQMRNWELARAQRPDVTAAAEQEVQDFVAVSRMVGAGGVKVANLLGEKLGWPVFDKEILNAMAGDDDLRRQIYETMDERDLSWMEEALRTVLTPQAARNDYFNRLTRTVLSLARKGRAVFLGRGADRILPSDRGLRIGLVAPLEYRVQHLVELRGLTSEKSREEIARIERERGDFMKSRFRVDADDPTRHDLIINMAKFTDAQAVDLILWTRKRRGAGPPEV